MKDAVLYDSLTSGSSAASVVLTFFAQTEQDTNKQTTNMQAKGRLPDKDFVVHEIAIYPETDTIHADLVKMYDRAVAELKINNNRVLTAPLMMFAPRNYITSTESTQTDGAIATYAGVRSDTGFVLKNPIVIPKGAPFLVEVTLGHQTIGTASDVKVVLIGEELPGGSGAGFSLKGNPHDYIYYDTNDVGTAASTDIEFFNGSESADTLALTNLAAANQLPENEDFIIEEIHVLFTTDMVLNDAAELLEEGMVELLINNNREIILPALLCGSDFRTTNAVEDHQDTTSDAIGAAAGGAFKLRNPIRIPGGVPFKARFRTGTTAAGSGQDVIIALRGIRTVM